MILCFVSYILFPEQFLVGNSNDVVSVDVNDTT